jgi:predicted metal-dependent phosphoesterase TrpH
MKKTFETLHAHTILSDGKMTHKEVLEKAYQYNLGVVAFTDHDCLPTEEAWKYLQEHKDGPVRWICGIEISAALPPEAGGTQDSGLHILGLFVDPHDAGLREHCVKAKQARIERMEHIVGGLQRLGFVITAEDCVAASGGEVVAKPHIVTALKAKAENLVLLDKLVEQAGKDAEHNVEIKKKYDEMMKNAEYQRPYSMFLSSDAILPGIYAEDKYAISLDDTVKLIRNAGGVAVMAHYFTIKKKISLELLEKLLAEKRLDGLETVFGLWNIGTEKWAETEELANLCAQLATKHGAAQTGGVDLHYEDDFVKFVENAEYSEKTIGMTQELIDATGVAKKWSAL